MNKQNTKWWIAGAVLICCLTPGAIAESHRGGRCPESRNCVQVPEGGSSAIYLIGAGLTCAGAVLLGSRYGKLAKS